MLCPPVIGCYSVIGKEFHIVSVEKLGPVKWDVGAMDRLVLEEKKKDMLKGLVGQHYIRDEGVRGDLIAGKGQSLVIPLYGPPGVRPLFPSPTAVYYVLDNLLTVCLRSAKRLLPRVSLRLYKNLLSHLALGI